MNTQTQHKWWATRPTVLTANRVRFLVHNPFKTMSMVTGLVILSCTPDKASTDEAVNLAVEAVRQEARENLLTVDTIGMLVTNIQEDERNVIITIQDPVNNLDICVTVLPSRETRIGTLPLVDE